MNLKRVLDGLVVIAVGVVLLGNTLGILPWTVWLTILMLWPLLLVAAGIDIIGKSMDSNWLRLLSGLLVLGGIAYGAYVGLTGLSTAQGWWMPVKVGESKPFEFAEAGSSDVEVGSARIAGGIGRLSIAEGDRLVTAEGETPFGAPDIVALTDDGKAIVKATLGNTDRWTFPSGGNAWMDLKLGEDIEWETVKIDAGVSTLDADLSRLQIRRLEVDMGISNGELTIGDALSDGSSVDIDSGISTFKLRVPEDAEIEIVSDEGLGNIDVPGDFAKDGRSWRTPGFDNAEDGWTIRMKAGISNVDVERY